MNRPLLIITVILLTSLPYSLFAATTNEKRERFEKMFSEDITPQDQKALQNQYRQSSSVQNLSPTDTKNTFRADFAQRLQEAKSLTGSLQKEALATIAKDRADLEKAIADAKIQMRAEKQTKKQTKKQTPSQWNETTKSRLQKEISAAERFPYSQQLKQFKVLLRSIDILILAQKSVGADGKVALLESMRSEVQARMELLPSE